MTYSWFWRQTNTGAFQKSMYLVTVTEPPRTESIISPQPSSPRSTASLKRPFLSKHRQLYSRSQNCRLLEESWILNLALKWLYGSCPTLPSKMNFPSVLSLFGWNGSVAVVWFCWYWGVSTGQWANWIIICLPETELFTLCSPSVSLGSQNHVLSPAHPLWNTSKGALWGLVQIMPNTSSGTATAPWLVQSLWNHFAQRKELFFFHFYVP